METFTTVKRVRRIEPKHNPKQEIALRTLLSFENGVSELLYGGAAGGGKSWVGCEWLILMCLNYPGTRYLMGRAKLLALKQTTYKTFLEVAKTMGQKAGKDFKFNGNENTIFWKNGSEIILKDLFQYPSDPDFDGLGSLEITGAFIDEVNQVTQKAKETVMSRIRYKLDEFGLSPKLFMSCNPAKNWVYNEFYKPWLDSFDRKLWKIVRPDGKTDLIDYRRFIQATSDDNKEFIDSHYRVLLSRITDKAQRSRLLRGEWEYSGDLSMFDFVELQETLSRRRAVKRGMRYFIAADIARLGKDKTVIMVCSENLEIVEVVEVHHRKMKAKNAAHKPSTYDAKLIKKLQEKYDVDEYDIAIDADGVGGGVIDQLENAESIQNGSRALNDENYQNLKTQLYFKLAELVNEGAISFVDPVPKKKGGQLVWSSSITDAQAEMLAQELQILERDKVEQDGKVCMTPKARVKRMLGRSPDYSDCLAYLMFFFLEEFDDGYLAM